MGVRYASQFSNTFIGPLPATAAETQVFQTPPINPPLDSSQIMLMFSCDVTAGATVTRHIFLIHRGAGLGGNNIFAVNIVGLQAAGARNVTTGCYFDNPGPVSNLIYTLTIQQFGATGAGVFNDGCLLAFVL